MAMPFNLAVAQAPAELDGPEARLNWLDEVLPDISANGSDLLLLPELFTCGYHIGDAVADRAEAVDGPIAQAIAALAQAHSIAIHYGFAERAADLIYNAAQCFGPDGTVLTHQRKLAIPPGAERAYFTAGRGCQLFEYRGLRIATLICYDAEYPETVRHVAALGAELVLVPTALGAEWGWVAHSMIPTRAYENGIYLAYSNSAGVENGFAFLGSSVVAAPDGVEITRAGAKPEILFASLEKARVQQAQRRLPYLQERSAIELNSSSTKD